MAHKIAVLSIVALSGILVGVLLGQSQEKANWRTRGELNGRAWMLEGTDFKLGYLVGSEDALANAGGALSIMGASSCTSVMEQVWRGFTTPEKSRGEVQVAIDQFYSEPENLPLSFHNALTIIGMKYRNVTPGAIERRLAAMRSVATDQK